jgi:hypothetical protein
VYEVLRATSLLVQYYCFASDFVSLCNKIWSTHVLCGMTAVIVCISINCCGLKSVVAKVIILHNYMLTD